MMDNYTVESVGLGGSISSCRHVEKNEEVARAEEKITI